MGVLASQLYSTGPSSSKTLASCVISVEAALVEIREALEAGVFVAEVFVVLGAHIKSSHPEVVAPLYSTKSEEEESAVVLTQRCLDSVSPKGVVNHLHYLIYSFVNDAGISAGHACNNDLYKIIDYAVQNASILSKQQLIVMRQHRFQQIQLASFANMIRVIQSIVLLT